MDLAEKIKTIIHEIKDSGVPDRVIQSALIDFAKSAREFPLEDPAKKKHDSVVISFLKDVVREDNAIKVYTDFYFAAIKGDVYLS